jgi:hypothetical protein
MLIVKKNYDLSSELKEITQVDDFKIIIGIFVL